METPKIFDSELQFCEILWAHQPVRSSELAHLCAEKLGWKKSTTYTEIKRLCEKGVLQNEHAVVTPLVTQEEYQQQESRSVLEKLYGNSLKRFVNALYQGEKMKKEDIQELSDFLKEMEEDQEE